MRSSKLEDGESGEGLIRNFADKESAKIFQGLASRLLPREIQKRALIRLMALDQALELHDLRLPPSNHLEALKGQWVGFHSMRVNDQWRIVFRWEKGNALDVQIMDYH